MIWGRRCPIHRERAKLLDRAVAAHVDCCVLCVQLWLCFVSYVLVESQHWPRQNGPSLHTHSTKLAHKHPKYDWMCKLVIIQRVLTFCLQSCFGRAMSAQKKLLKFAKISEVENLCARKLTVDAKTIFPSLNSRNYIEFRDNIKVIATF